MEEKKTIPVTPPVTAARRVFPVDGRDRALLVLAWGVGVLCAEALLWGLSGLVMTLLAAAWYGVLFWYGGAAPLARRENRLLLYAVGLLALTFALFANPWLRLWNTLALVLLMGIQMGGWPGMEVYSVGTSAMLGERFLRLSGRVGSGAGLHSGPLPQKDALCPGGTAGVRSTADGALSPAHIGGCAVRPGDPPGGGLV